MAVQIRVVQSKKDLKTFVKFPFSLYCGNQNWVPPLIREEMELFDEKKNPAYADAEARLFLAEKEGRPVGRVAAILSHAANRKYGTRNLRFGWFESIEDDEVASALFGAVRNWGREKGLETMTGPHGFCDLDQEGLLVEGFDQMATIAVYYNPPYYERLFEQNGLHKEIDYIEFKTFVPHDTGIPEKLLRLSERVRERSRLRVVRFSSRKEVMRRSREIFSLLDESFEEIYGSVPLSEKQIEYYIKKYFTFVDKDLLGAVENEEGEIVGFMIALPSMSRAFQKAGGRLLPLGWFYILQALRRSKVLDFYLAGIKKCYRGQGVDLLMVIEITKAALAKGYEYAESNPELETNTKIHAQWKYFNPSQHKRRRIFRGNV